MRSRTFLGLGLAAACWLATTSAIAADDIENGAATAKEWCAACHDISENGPFKEYPPSFAAIAVYRSPEQILWRIQIPPEHARMPRVGYVLDKQTILDLVAYIVSLEKQPD